MITNINVKSVDESLGGTGGRVLSIKRSGRAGFETPSRPFSVPEFIAKGYLGFRGTLDGYLGAVQIDLHGERLVRFSSRNGMFDRTRQRLIKFSDLTCCFDNFAILDVPPVNPLDEKSMKLFFELQARARFLEYISVPQLLTKNQAQFKSVIIDYSRGAKRFGKGIVPQIALNDDVDSFSKKLDVLATLAETGEISIINLIYADPDANIQNYLEMWKNREIEAIVNISGVPRNGREVGPGVFETVQSRLINYGADTTTPIRVTPSGGYTALRLFQPRPVKIEDIDRFKWPIHPAATTLQDKIWRRLPKEIMECDCKVCNTRIQDELVEIYSREPNGQIEPSGMRYASNLHDALSSQMELSLARKRIRETDMAEYVKEKDFARAEIMSYGI